MRYKDKDKDIMKHIKKDYIQGEYIVKNVPYLIKVNINDKPISENIYFIYPNVINRVHLMIHKMKENNIKEMNYTDE